MAEPTREPQGGDTTRKAKLFDGSNWASREERMQQESAERPELLTRLQGEVDRLFPGGELAALRDDIMERSVNVPQYGEHHNEGALMSRHLEAILDNLEAMKNGQFLDAVPADVRQVLQEVARDHEDELKRYVFLHDIGKADSLTLRFEDDETRDAWMEAHGGTFSEDDKGKKGLLSVSWEQWQAVVPAEIQTDPVALDEYLASQGLKEANGIAYLKHERASQAAVDGREAELGISPLTTATIETHSLVYQFSGVSAEKFNKHFGRFSKDEMRFVLAANLIDTSASISPDGTSDLSNYRDIVDSYYNSQKCAAISEALMPGGVAAAGLDGDKLAKELKTLLQQNTRIESEVDDIVAELRESCRLPQYNQEALRAKLTTDLADLIEAGVLSEADVETVVGAIDSETGILDQRAVGPLKGKLRKDTRRLMAILNSPEVLK